MSTKKINLAFDVFVLLMVFVLSAIALQPRISDVLIAYEYVTGQIFKDISTVISASQVSKIALKDPTDSELKKNLLSVDTRTRLQAIEKISEKKDSSFIPLLIKLFGDSGFSDSSPQGASITISEAARVAVVKLYKDIIIEDPQNLKNLIPLFNASTKGTSAEQKGASDVLRQIREPLAIGIIGNKSQSLTGKDRNLPIPNVSEIPHQQNQSGGYLRELHSRQYSFVWVLLSAVSLLAVLVAWNIFRTRNLRTVAIGILALLINLGLTWLVMAEMDKAHSLSTDSLAASLRDVDAMAIRSMIYAENCKYPPDSKVLQELARTCDPAVVAIMSRVGSIEPDDLPSYRRLTETSKKWVLSRIIMTNLDAPCLDLILKSADESVCQEIINSIDGLKVTNEKLERLLKMISSRGPGGCAKEAAKVLDVMKNRPNWSY